MTSSEKNKIESSRPSWVQKGYDARFQNFQGLMRHRIRDILLVSSLYDFFIFEEDGRIYELIRDKYQGLNLTHTPELSQVSSGEEALVRLEDERFDLVLVTMHIDDMRPAALAKTIKDSHDIPVVMLAFDNKELSDMLLHHEITYFDEIFIWQGDYHLILAIIKTLEDRLNVARDTDIIGVQTILVIEDNILYYSSLLPMIYIEVMNHSQRLIEEGVNLMHRRLRMRARPKILLAKTYEEAWNQFEQYRETVLGVISDIDYKKGDVPCADAGLRFAEDVKKVHSDIPILLHSTQSAHEAAAKKLGVSFVLKDSPILLQKLRRFMMNQLSFGDFIFRMPDGTEIGRAHDLQTLEQELIKAPEASIAFHAERNHFSNWLKARTEFWLAHEIRLQRLSDFPTIEDARNNLLKLLSDYRKLRQQGMIMDFNTEGYDSDSTLARIGSGSLGGKARGLTFVNMLITNSGLMNKFHGVQIGIPQAVIIATDVFDKFLDENHLRDFALSSDNDQEILTRFLAASRFSEKTLKQLAAFLDVIRTPVAVRSSSLLEDSHVHPFAGVYKTYMLPNANPDPAVRLQELVSAIKKVYASTFYQSAKKYVKVTPYRVEEEKMAVVIQKIVGSVHDSRYYPTFSGVAKSYNYYPVAPQEFNDGIVNIALGMGKTVVEGGLSVRFCPRYPKMNLSGSTARDIIRNAQQEFYAVNLDATGSGLVGMEDSFLGKYPLDVAEKDGVLTYVASAYSQENDRITEGLSRDGIRIITFAPILRNRLLPIHDILSELLNLGSWGMGSPVEIEFAVNLSEGNTPHQFSALQMRPIVLNRELEVFNIGHYQRDELICQSDQVLGNDILNDIHDIVMVDIQKFDRSRSREVVEEVSTLNAELISRNCPYLLIGVGRWGSLDPWLGIPVTWEQISGARAIVEAGFKDFSVEPSQGTHFFQNLNSFEVGYFTIARENDDNFIDWSWLFSRPSSEQSLTRHIHFDHPVIIKMSAHQKKGIILKPEA